MSKDEATRIDEGGTVRLEPGQVVRMACCDCGKVHDIIITFVSDGTDVFAVDLKFHGNEEATAERREEAMRQWREADA